MYRAALLVGLAACGFEHGRTPTGDAADPIDDSTIPSDTMPLDSTLPLDGPPPSMLCANAPTSLRACFTFDGNLQDGTTNNNDATASPAAMFVTGHAGQALVTSSGTFTVGVSSSLDVSAVTMKMWIRPNSLPAGVARMGLMDSGSRYRMFVLADGALRCAITDGPSLVTAAGVVAINTWQRVACTYNAVEMKIFVNGTQRALLNSTQAIPSANSGMVIGHNNPSGENFDGAIDELQVFGAVVAP